MTADTQAQGDLPKLALEHGNIQSNWRGDTEYVFSKHGLETFAAALQGQEGEPSDAADAARYRWLRDKTCNLHFEYRGGGWKTAKWHMNDRGDNPAYIDQAIDSARAALAQESRGVEIREAR